MIYMAFFELCLLRRKPQDLPQSIELLIICFIIYILVSLLLGLCTSSFAVALNASILETIFISVITSVILKLNHHPERWLKTLMSILGTGIIMSLFALPVYWSIFVLDIGELLHSMILIVYLALLLWNVVIMGYILRHALETTMGMGMMFAIIYIIITSLLIGILVPQIKLQ